MENHIIICGYGENGRRIAAEFERAEIDYVVIEKEPPAESKKIIRGTAKSEEVLFEAGIEKARTVVVAVSNDVEATFIVLLVKALNEKATVIEKADRRESVNKLYAAGASLVVNPSTIGGRMAAKAAVENSSVEEVFNRVGFVEGLEVVQHRIDRHSPFYNRRLRELRISRSGIYVIAVEDSTGTRTALSTKMKFKEGQTVTLLGEPNALEELLMQKKP